MFRITIGAGTKRHEVEAQPQETPRNIFSRLGISVENASTYCNGARMDAAEMDTPLSQLGLDANAVNKLNVLAALKNA